MFNLIVNMAICVVCKEVWYVTSDFKCIDGRENYVHTSCLKSVTAGKKLVLEKNGSVRTVELIVRQ